jgi:DNA-directed RNA polymerase subunit K/omega
VKVSTANRVCGGTCEIPGLFYFASQMEPVLPEWLTAPDGQPIQFVNTTPMTKFERAVVLGQRALKIGQNDRPRVQFGVNDDPLTIARAELKAGSIPPMSLLRYMPDGTVQRKTVAELYRNVRT